jgi:hypothetical protein
VYSHEHTTHREEPVVRERRTTSPCRGAVSTTEGADAELVELFDRYLAVFADATRRFGNLFPYNQLKLRIQSLLAGRTARVQVRDATGAAVAMFDLEWRDGEFRRVVEAAEPAFAWVLDTQTLEDVSAAPWAYLAHPRRLRLAWFHADGLRAADHPSTPRT